MKVPFLIGRLLFGGFFFYNGINHLRNRKTMGQYAQSKGVPNGEAAVAISAIPLLIGGTSLLLGIKPKLGALAILGFLAGVSPVMHDFWRNEDPNERMNNMINFMKNLALAGGAMALFWAIKGGFLKETLTGTRDLIYSFGKRGLRPHDTLVLSNSSTRKMPYAPAIAIGTIFSFFAVR